MTAHDLLSQTWNCMRDRPTVNYPWRASTLAKCLITNENGVVYEAQVLTNRTGTRWWLEIQNNHWLTAYRTTTSKKLKDEWIGALQL